MIKNIKIPRYILQGIKANHTGFPKRLRFWGADFETFDGKPYTFQVCGQNLVPEIIRVNEKNVLDIFLDYFKDKILSQQVNIVYFHNLQFDISVLLYKYHKEFLGHKIIKINYKGCKIKAIVSNITFATIEYPNKKSLFLYDSSAFIKGSLENLAEKLNLPVKKLPRPKFLGEKKLWNKEFINYAKNDAVVQYYLAKWIIDQHFKYDIRICVSVSQYSMKIFRHYFLMPHERIIFPPKELTEGAILSYHGGKNGFYFDNPVIIRKCIELDINSAYPYAMANIPNMVKGYYKKVKKFHYDYEGIYCVSGEAIDCKYPIIFDHEFKKVSGKFDKIWLTSYEIKEALRTKELKIKKIKGWIWIDDKKYKHNPLKEFVMNFWDKKEKANSYENKTLYKLILNSLYGKFIQATDIEENTYVFNPETQKTLVQHNYKAGGMFNPFIASLITGFVRAYIHKLEHKYKSLHTATDSIKTIQKIDEKKLPSGLGGLKKELEGKCIILRNKLYIHYDTLNKIKKFALHGFTGRVDDLLNIIKSKNTSYTVKKMLKVREALRQGLSPLKMTELEKELDVNLSNVKII